MSYKITWEHQDSALRWAPAVTDALSGAPTSCLFLSNRAKWRKKCYYFCNKRSVVPSRAENILDEEKKKHHKNNYTSILLWGSCIKLSPKRRRRRISYEQKSLKDPHVIKINLSHTKSTQFSHISCCLNKHESNLSVSQPWLTGLGVFIYG